MDIREQNLTNWLKERLGASELRTSPIVGDASFRRYFRVHTPEHSLVAMDAPPELENSHSFVSVQKMLNNLGLCVPDLLHIDLSEGFLLMSDFGDKLFLKHVSMESANTLYTKALEELLLIQKCENPNSLDIPHFNKHFMQTELNNFTLWFLEKYLGFFLTPDEKALLEKVYGLLIQEALAQPQVFMHRDYHSRNLMLLPNGRIGILDFQDAVLGPVTYDMVSLLRDCYVDWPKPMVLNWLYDYKKLLEKEHIIDPVSDATFLKWFDWMGMQRHLKAIFIFARKKLRDNDGNYLKDIPRALNYVIDVTSHYEEFQEFHLWLKNYVLPQFNKVNVL